MNCTGNCTRTNNLVSKSCSCCSGETNMDEPLTLRLERPPGNPARSLDAQKSHQLVEILASRIRLSFRNQPRIAKAPLVIAHDPVVLGENGELIVPRSSIQKVSMHENEWRPCTRNFIIQLCAIYLRKPSLHASRICHSAASLFFMGLFR